jgi:Fe2+-dicitrate sensor, membrane component
MNFKSNKTNIAWDNLYTRLENDGLLQDTKHPTRKTIYYRIISVAAVFVACIISGLYFSHTRDLPQKEMCEVYNEANAPILATMLEDGSIVYLSQQTTLKYPDHFDDDNRTVALKGDAFFDIRQQADRPFVIETESAKVEVTGTSFSIKNTNNSMFLLSVREGSVKVTKKSDLQAIDVKAGVTILLDVEKGTQLINSEAIFDDYFKRLHFKDEFLKNVVSIINIHSGEIKLKIEPDIEMRSLTYTLPEKIDIHEVAGLICLALDLQHEQKDNTVYISKKK